MSVAQTEIVQRLQQKLETIVLSLAVQKGAYKELLGKVPNAAFQTTITKILVGFKIHIDDDKQVTITTNGGTENDLVAAGIPAGMARRAHDHFTHDTYELANLIKGGCFSQLLKTALN